MSMKIKLTEAAPHPLVVRQCLLGGRSLATHDLHVRRLFEGELTIATQQNDRVKKKPSPGFFYSSTSSDEKNIKRKKKDMKKKKVPGITYCRINRTYMKPKPTARTVYPKTASLKKAGGNSGCIVWRAEGMKRITG